MKYFNNFHICHGHDISQRDLCKCIFVREAARNQGTLVLTKYVPKAVLLR